MVGVRTAGAVLNLLSALWAIYISLVAGNRRTLCPADGCLVTLSYLPTVLLAVAVILVIDAAICFVGLRAGFAAGAVLSAVIGVLVVVQWSAHGDFGSSLAVALSAVALILDLVSTFRRRSIPEEMHPLNLPVFG